MVRAISGFLGGGAGIMGSLLGAYATVADITDSQKACYGWVLLILGVVAIIALGIFCVSEVTRDCSQKKREIEADQNMIALRADVQTLLVANKPKAQQIAHGEGTVEYVWWTKRQTLREQVADLIRNCRTASEALSITPDERYPQVLSDVSKAFVGPSIAIRQAMRRALGYPLAEPLSHLPIATNSNDFDTVAEVHERLLKSVPTDFPAVPLEPNE